MSDLILGNPYSCHTPPKLHPINHDSSIVEVTSCLSAAVSYASRGWLVIPLVPGEKVPLTSHGYKDATTDIKIIEQWWNQYPEANVGIATGQRSGLCVIDIDVKKGINGYAAWSDFECESGDQVTLSASTPSGGQHYYYIHPQTGVKCATAVRPGIDIRADGGYVVVPPSRINGNSYQWLNDVPLAEFPSGFLTTQNKKIVSGDFAEINSPLSGVQEGQRNDVIFQYSSRLHRRGLSIEEVSVLALKKSENCSPPFPEHEALKVIESACKYPIVCVDKHVESTDGYALWHTDLPETDWIIDDILPAGLTVLAGKPKAGKSFLAFSMALSIANNDLFLGRYGVTDGVAFMLALEDTKSRLRTRMKMLSSDAPPQGSLILCTNWGEADIEGLRQTVASTINVKLLIVDTLARFRPGSKANSDIYAKDYADIASLKSVADEFGISVVVIHHTRKMKSSDPFEMISGTHGITGAADTMWLLEHDKKSELTNLHIRGRDIEDTTLNLQFDGGNWSVFGDYESPPTKQEIKLMYAFSDKPFSPKDVENLLGTSYANSAKIVQRMFAKGLVTKVGHGKYIFESL